MTIRSACRSDIPAMAGLMAELFSIEDDFTPDREKQSAALAMLINDPNAIVSVAEIEEKVVGMVSVQRFISTATGNYAGVLEDMVVTHRYRSRKIGSTLLHHAITEGINRGWKRFSLGSDIRNSAAIAFYERHGFVGSHLHLMYFFPSA
ncbi:MAG: GNAT family N-acetyltransferase [Campylobacterales bacterium]|nr:GNAT family N-acetyltransferase [Campylobacterales bacterium]